MEKAEASCRAFPLFLLVMAMRAPDEWQIRLRPRAEDAYESLRRDGLPIWLADVLARRLEQPVPLADLSEGELARLPDPGRIPGMNRAVERIVQAIERGEKIAFACDHDSDGIASAAVLWTAFTDHFGVPAERLTVVTSHRLTEGYGLSMPVAERIKASGATLTITADKGSSDEERIAWLKAEGVEVIVTDHHLLPAEGAPSSALAVVNPKSPDSGYDPNLCGAAVAFLVMAKVRSRLLETGLRQHVESVAALLDYVAVATVADCVSLRPDRSWINRLLARRGLALINERRRPAWRVFLAEQEGEVTAETVAFKLAPPVAAAGRMNWADAGFHFFIASTDAEAAYRWQLLEQENYTRRQVERQLRLSALTKAEGHQGQSLVLYLEEGHCGVHGITASRLVDIFGKPTALFAPSAGQDGLISGSFRGVPGFHVRDALQAVADAAPGLLCAFGGHEGAAGATLALADFPRFVSLFEAETRRQLGDAPLRPVYYVDADWPAELLTLETMDILGRLEPWGNDFAMPLLIGRFVVVKRQLVGRGGHLRLLLEREGRSFPAIWFNTTGMENFGLGINVGRMADFVYRLSVNHFRGVKSLQLQIVGGAPAS